MNKRAQITLFVLIAIILVGNVVILALMRERAGPDPLPYECQSDEQCIPSTNCEATTCTLNTSEINYSSIICDPGIPAGLIPEDCLCINTRCEVV